MMMLMTTDDLGLVDLGFLGKEGGVIVIQDRQEDEEAVDVSDPRRMAHSKVTHDHGMMMMVRTRKIVQDLEMILQVPEKTIPD